MEKWADYLVSGVWFKQEDESMTISDMMVHLPDDCDERLMGIKLAGHKLPAADVIKFLKAKLSVRTVKWDYEAGKWSNGTILTYETRDGVDYLCTYPGASAADSLENLLNMGLFNRDW